MTSDESEIKLVFFDDLHCHLRESSQSVVAKSINSGGSDRVLVMPNLRSPIVTCDQALLYHNFLLDINPHVDYLMTLYLNQDISISDLEMNAARSHVQGIKCYPKGVTTNSSFGFKCFQDYYPLFNAMEKLSLSLHIHCETIDSNPLFSEQNFIPQLHQICNKFSNLKIVAEHVTSKELVDFVKNTPNIAASVTIHHLELLASDVISQMGHENTTADDLCNHITNPHYYCKPMPKTFSDRQAILDVITSGHPRFYFGSDSAPHKINDKLSNNPPAGIFTQPYLALYLADIFSRLNCLDKLQPFVSQYGKDYLLLPEIDNRRHLTLIKQDFKIPELEFDMFRPYKAGQYVSYSIKQNDSLNN
ncbi:dihydroorotase [Babesia microti strain RI]|uniref:Dihydroorotase n=1 Tax=Babesia microti (strain RI) TaxID=1133968 RepID=I7J5G5_BABMR|nr:dihydroorotase [Babesia microti strain RI]CCF72857.1 dihydroorotase [Babesia microti strain RI]|eukprot:XP_012647466.1 dihydroorotase [Babesia microti strain RI]